MHFFPLNKSLEPMSASRSVCSGFFALVAALMAQLHRWIKQAFMTPLRIGILAAIAIQFSCLADVTKLPSERRKALQDASRFHEIFTVTNLPDSVVALCADPNRRLAEPGQEWELTDVIRDPKAQRLIRRAN